MANEFVPMVPVGYFTDPGDKTPEYDPGLSAPCPVCSETLSLRPRVTISLGNLEGTLSLFFRAHKDCWNGVSDEIQGEIEGRILSAIFPESVQGESE